MTTVRYSDIDLSFTRNASTHDIFKVKDSECVKNSIINLVLTNFGERKFHPEIGSGVYSMLFDNGDAISGFLLEQRIRETISKFEPRASIVEINVNVEPDKNIIEMFLSFTILNINKPETINLTIKRNR